MKKILVIAAHPDDEVLGCGGTLNKYSRNGSKIRVIFIAEGTTGRFSDINLPRAKKEILRRTSYGVEALSCLGVDDFQFYDLPCGALDTIPQLSLNKIIEKEIESYRPTAILTHWWADANSDHRCVYRSVITATRPIENNLVNSILCFETLSSTEWNFLEPFKANHYEALSANDIEKKIEAMKIYASEIHPFPHPRSEDAIASKGKVRGSEAGCLRAEAFHIVRSINP